MLHIAAIPTVYKGVQMRSRLEARWAAFFDLCGWQWEYEPFDLNGWIPDFYIKNNRALVEIKPFDIDVSPPRDITDVATKIRNALGNQQNAMFESVYLLGLNIRSFWDANLPTELSRNGFRPRTLEKDEPLLFANLSSLWVQAGNTAQWKSPRKDPKSKLPKSKLLPVTPRDIAVAEVCAPLLKSFLKSLNEDERRWARTRYHKSHVINTRLPDILYAHPLFHDMNRAIRVLTVFLHQIGNNHQYRSRMSAPLAVLWEISPDTFNIIVKGRFFDDQGAREASLGIRAQIAALLV